MKSLLTKAKVDGKTGKQENIKAALPKFSHNEGFDILKVVPT
jgi:hypothetical protein